MYFRHTTCITIKYLWHSLSIVNVSFFVHEFIIVFFFTRKSVLLKCTFGIDALLSFLPLLPQQGQTVQFLAAVAAKVLCCGRFCEKMTTVAATTANCRAFGRVAGKLKFVATLQENCTVFGHVAGKLLSFWPRCRKTVQFLAALLESVMLRTVFAGKCYLCIQMQYKYCTHEIFTHLKGRGGGGCYRGLRRAVTFKS